MTGVSLKHQLHAVWISKIYAHLQCFTVEAGHFFLSQWSRQTEWNAWCRRQKTGTCLCQRGGKWLSPVPHQIEYMHEAVRAWQEGDRYSPCFSPPCDACYYIFVSDIFQTQSWRMPETGYAMIKGFPKGEYYAKTYETQTLQLPLFLTEKFAY